MAPPRCAVHQAARPFGDPLADRCWSALLTTAIVLIGTSHLVAGHDVANLTAYRIAFLVAAAFCLTGVASALSIHAAAAAIPSRRVKDRLPNGARCGYRTG